ncbi:hypothetical protein MMC09_005771 [Bachmanniomyces sp. S44760]|nr:hypothetical protein [Bachmanniomyces sp. S44760]
MSLPEHRILVMQDVSANYFVCLNVKMFKIFGTFAADPDASDPAQFTTRTLLRPSILPTHEAQPPFSQATAGSNVSAASAPLLADLMPKISTHPALASAQVRNGPRNTYDPSHRVRKRRAGFLARVKSRTGRAILKRRRLKRRSTLSH